MKIITPMQAMALMGLTGRATATGIMRHQSKFEQFDIAVVEKTTLESGKMFDGDNITGIEGLYYRSTLDRTIEEINLETSHQRRSRFSSEADHMRYDLEELEKAGNVVDWQPWLDIKAQIRNDLPYLT
jgi:hypothetical protein